MKKVLILIAFCFITTAAYASGEIDCNSYFYKNFHNSCVTQDDNGRDNPAGIGVDVPLYIHEKGDVDLEVRADLENNEESFFVVFKPNMEEGLLQKVGGFLKGLFNRGE